VAAVSYSGTSRSGCRTRVVSRRRVFCVLAPIIPIRPFPYQCRTEAVRQRIIADQVRSSDPVVPIANDAGRAMPCAARAPLTRTELGRRTFLRLQLVRGCCIRFVWQSFTTRGLFSRHLLPCPSALSDTEPWQIAMEQLIDAAKDRNMHARIGMMRALRRGDPKLSGSPRPCVRDRLFKRPVHASGAAPPARFSPSGLL
jgi:hypothetical protein